MNRPTRRVRQAAPARSVARLASPECVTSRQHAQITAMGGQRVAVMGGRGSSGAARASSTVLGTLANCFSMAATDGTPQAIAPQEPRIERTFPADEAMEIHYVATIGDVEARPSFRTRGPRRIRSREADLIARMGRGTGTHDAPSAIPIRLSLDSRPGGQSSTGGLWASAPALESAAQPVGAP